MFFKIISAIAFSCYCNYCILVNLFYFSLSPKFIVEKKGLGKAIISPCMFRFKLKIKVAYEFDFLFKKLKDN